jgi:transcriptional regulator with AAA-type ATPase domain/polyferredoxin
MKRAGTSAERSSEGATRLADSLRAAIRPLTVEEGEIVVRQGETGVRFYYIESGALDVVVTSEDGVRLPVARLGPGAHFGEMSLLTGTPVSADVVATERSVLYALTGPEFQRLAQQDAGLMEYLASEMALRLKQTNEQLAAQQQRQATLSRLLSPQTGPSFKADLLGLGKSTGTVITEAIDSDRPLLITGEKGAGKKALARYIHAQSARGQEAVLVVDCREMEPDDARGQLFGDADPQAVDRFADRLGYLQAADRGTLVLGNVERFPAEVQQDLAVFLRTSRNSSVDSGVNVRVIATIDGAEGSPPPEQGLCDELRRAFADGHVIRLQPLRQRRRDIVPLAEHFLAWFAQISGHQQQKQLDESARRELLGYDFRFENAEELKQVIRLAADLAEADVVTAGHLFFGPGGAGDAPHVDLLQWNRVEEIVRRGRLLTGLRAVVALTFAAIVVAGLAAPGSAVGRLANLMVWGIWWPVLVISSVLFGRIWCAVCPLSSGADAVQRAAGRGITPPDIVKRAGIAFAVAGFVLIIWTELVAGMGENARFTAYLLLGLALIAGVAGWVWQRHVWCRYLCPLGAMSAVFSVVSTVRLQARREVCQASCAGNECYKGSEYARGCPMFNHALFLTGGQHCKLCFECLRACPSRSPRLVLRLPLRDVWRSNLIAADLAPLAAVVGLSAILLAATPAAGLQSAFAKRWFSAGAALTVLVGLVLSRVFRPPTEGADSASLSWAARAMYAYTPAIAAVLFAFHVRSAPWLHKVAVRVGPNNGDAFAISLLQLVQIAAAVIGGCMTLMALWRLCRERFGPQLVSTFAVWTPLGLSTIGYLLCGLVLLGARSG